MLRAPLSPSFLLPHPANHMLRWPHREPLSHKFLVFSSSHTGISLTSPCFSSHCCWWTWDLIFKENRRNHVNQESKMSVHLFLSIILRGNLKKPLGILEECTETYLPHSFDRSVFFLSHLNTRACIGFLPLAKGCHCVILFSTAVWELDCHSCGNIPTSQPAKSLMKSTDGAFACSRGSLGHCFLPLKISTAAKLKITGCYNCILFFSLYVKSIFKKMLAW